MSGLVDTNVLLYGANSSAPEHALAVRFLEAAGRAPGRWYLTEGIVHEFLRVSTHPRVFPRPLSWRQGLQFLRPFLQSGGFSVLQAGKRHWDLLAELLAELAHPAGNLFFDIRTAALMREHGVRDIYTRDADFLQIPGIRVIDPMKS